MKHKALTQMNVRLANVLFDVVGATGQKILRAIVAGERDGQVLGSMKNARIRASVDEIAKSLQGNCRSEHLVALILSRVQTYRSDPFEPSHGLGA